MNERRKMIKKTHLCQENVQHAFNIVTTQAEKALWWLQLYDGGMFFFGPYHHFAG